MHKKQMFHPFGLVSKMKPHWHLTGFPKPSHIHLLVTLIGTPVPLSSFMQLTYPFSQSCDESKAPLYAHIKHQNGGEM